MNVLDFAEQVDRSGQQFYQGLSSRAQHPGIKRIFTLLADDERMLLNRIQDLRTHEDYAKYDSTALNRSENIFDQLRRQEDRFRLVQDLDAYHLALDAERMVVREYREAIRRETQPEVRHLLERIARDEEQELNEIEQLYNFVNAPNENLEWGEFSNLQEFHNFGRDVDV